jgi:hypothetical protein
MSFSEGNFGFLGKNIPKKIYKLIAGKNPIFIDYLLGYMISDDPFSNTLLYNTVIRYGGLHSFEIVSNLSSIPKISSKKPNSLLKKFYKHYIKEDNKKLCSFFLMLCSKKDTEQIFLPFKCNNRLFFSPLHWYYFFLAHKGYRKMNKEIKKMKKIVEQYKNVVPLSYKNEAYAYNIFLLERNDIERLLVFLQKNGKDIRHVNTNIYWSGNRIYINNNYVEINSFSPLASFSAFYIVKGIKSVKWSLENVLEDLEGWVHIYKVEPILGII